MVGNHRDAWGFGAMDPSSGTAAMLEVARVLGEKLKTGWRPRRTIIFLSWGAEEFGLTGLKFLLLACHKKSYLICGEIMNFGIFTQPIP